MRNQHFFIALTGRTVTKDGPYHSDLLLRFQLKKLRLETDHSTPTAKTQVSGFASP